jgi:hypothetical protein
MKRSTRISLAILIAAALLGAYAIAVKFGPPAGAPGAQDPAAAGFGH